MLFNTLCILQQVLGIIQTEHSRPIPEKFDTVFASGGAFRHSPIASTPRFGPGFQAPLRLLRDTGEIKKVTSTVIMPQPTTPSPFTAVALFASLISNRGAIVSGRIYPARLIAFLGYASFVKSI